LIDITVPRQLSSFRESPPTNGHVTVTANDEDDGTDGSRHQDGEAH